MRSPPNGPESVDGVVLSSGGDDVAAGATFATGWPKMRKAKVENNFIIKGLDGG